MQNIWEKLWLVWLISYDKKYYLVIYYEKKTLLVCDPSLISENIEQTNVCPCHISFLLYHCSKNPKMARHVCRWCVPADQLDDNRQRVYRCTYVLSQWHTRRIRRLRQFGRRNMRGLSSKYLIMWCNNNVDYRFEVVFRASSRVVLIKIRLNFWNLTVSSYFFPFGFTGSSTSSARTILVKIFS